MYTCVPGILYSILFYTVLTCTWYRYLHCNIALPIVQYSSTCTALDTGCMYRYVCTGMCIWHAPLQIRLGRQEPPRLILMVTSSSELAGSISSVATTVHKRTVLPMKGDMAGHHVLYMCWECIVTGPVPDGPSPSPSRSRRPRFLHSQTGHGAAVREP